MTELLILRLKMQANSKAQAFLLPIIVSLLLKVEREIEQYIVKSGW